MSSSFDDAYSAAYDIFYHEKDYQGEAAFVAELVARFTEGGGLAWLDMACGTGRHALEFAKLGHQVAGSDPSPGMLEHARRRTTESGRTLEWYPYSFQEADGIRADFDVISAMFSAVNYLSTDTDLATGLASVRTLLRPGGIFVFDIWNGNAVLDHHSPVRVRDVEIDGRRVHRVSTTDLDRLRNIAAVHFDVSVTEGNRIVSQFTEDHVLRYYFPQEMRDALERTGFELIHWCPFLEPNRQLDALDWNITFVAKRGAD